MHLYGQFTTKIRTIMTHKITLQMQGTVYAKMRISLVDITCKVVHLLQRLYWPFKDKHTLHVRRMQNFLACSQNCERRLLVSPCLPVCPSVRMEQFGSHWTDFHEILYLSIFRKSTRTIQVSLKSDNNGYFALWPIYIYDHTRSIILRIRNVSVKICRESQNTYFVLKKSFR
jgi:virulence-associated protein VapD